jgi:hypothetical protein
MDAMQFVASAQDSLDYPYIFKDLKRAREDA